MRSATRSSRGPGPATEPAESAGAAPSKRRSRIAPRGAPTAARTVRFGSILERRGAVKSRCRAFRMASQGLPPASASPHVLRILERKHFRARCGQARSATRVNGGTGLSGGRGPAVRPGTNTKPEGFASVAPAFPVPIRYGLSCLISRPVASCPQPRPPTRPPTPHPFPRACPVSTRS